jgi:hypothetical protein
MQKFKIRILVGRVYEVDVIARDILAANEYALELDEEADMLDLDDVDRCVYSSELITDEDAAIVRFS